MSKGRNIRVGIPKLGPVPFGMNGVNIGGGQPIMSFKEIGDRERYEQWKKRCKRERCWTSAVND